MMMMMIYKGINNRSGKQALWQVVRNYDDDDYADYYNNDDDKLKYDNDDALASRKVICMI
jgi:hypothetical protein